MGLDIYNTNKAMGIKTNAKAQQAKAAVTPMLFGVGREGEE